MAHGALTPIIGLRLLALAAGLRHNAEIGQPGLCFSAYGHKFGINHLTVLGGHSRARAARRPVTRSGSAPERGSDNPESDLVAPPRRPPRPPVHSRQRRPKSG